MHARRRQGRLWAVAFRDARPHAQRAMREGLRVRRPVGCRAREWTSPASKPRGSARKKVVFPCLTSPIIK
jgi:hypothetical protein